MSSADDTIKLLADLYVNIDKWNKNVDKMEKDVENISNFFRINFGTAANEAIREAGIEASKSVKSQFAISNEHEAKTKVKLANMVKEYGTFLDQLSEGSINFEQMSKSQVDGVEKLINGLREANIVGMDLNGTNDKSLKTSMDMYKAYVKLNDIHDINNKRVDTAGRVAKAFGININENILGAAKKLINGMPGASKIIDQLGLSSNATMKSLGGMADKGLGNLAKGGLLATGPLLAVIAAAALLYAAFKLLESAYDRLYKAGQLVIKNWEEYRMTNYRAIGSIVDLTKSTFDLVGAFGVSDEAAVKIIKSMGHAGFTLQSFGKNAAQSKEMLMQHTKVNLKFSEATGVSAESTARFMKVLSVINGTGAGGLKQTNALLGSITTSMKLYGLEAKDVEEVIGYMTTNAIRMNEIFGSQAVPKMSQYLIDLAARAKSVGVAFGGIQSKINEIVENPIDNILLLGSSAFKSVEARMEALRNKSVSIYAQMKEKAARGDVFGVSILEGIYKIKMEQVKVIAEEKEAWDKLGEEGQKIKLKQMADQEAVDKAWSESMNTITQAWNRAMGPITKFETEIAMPIVQALQWVVEGFAVVMEEMAKGWDMADEFFGLSEGIQYWIDDIKELHRELGILVGPETIEFIKGLGMVAAIAFKGIISFGFMVYAGLLEQIKMWAELSAWIMKSLKPVGKVLNDYIIEPMKKIVYWAFEVWDSLHGSSIWHIWESIMEFAAPALDLLSGAIEFLLDPIGKARAFFSELWNKIKTGSSEAVKNIKSFIDGPLEWLEKKLEKVKETAAGAWDIFRRYILPNMGATGAAASAGLTMYDASQSKAIEQSIKVTPSDLANHEKMANAVSSAIKEVDFSKITVSSKITVTPNGAIEISDKANNKAATIATKTKVDVGESKDSIELLNAIKLIATLVSKMSDNPISLDEVKGLLSDIHKAADKEDVLGNINNKSLTWKV